MFGHPIDCTRGKITSDHQRNALGTVPLVGDIQYRSGTFVDVLLPGHSTITHGLPGDSVAIFPRQTLTRLVRGNWLRTFTVTEPDGVQVEYVERVR